MRTNYHRHSYKCRSWSEALENFNINFKIQKVPLCIPETKCVVKNLFGLVRLDTGRPLEGVGVNSRYAVIQTDRYNKIAEQITQKLSADFVNGGEFRDGKLIYVQAQLPGTVQLSSEHHLEKHILFLNSFDGSKNFTILPILICSIGKSIIHTAGKNCKDFEIKIKHTSNALEKLHAPQQMHVTVRNAFEEFEEKIIQYLNTSFSVSQFEKLLLEMFCSSKDKSFAATSTAAKNQMEVCRAIYEGNKACAPYSGTLWGAYSALVEYSDWRRSIKNKTDNFESQLIGSSALFKHKLIEVLDTFSNIN